VLYRSAGPTPQPMNPSTEAANVSPVHGARMLVCSCSKFQRSHMVAAMTAARRDARVRFTVRQVLTSMYSYADTGGV
jgi:hypothetical protein